MKLKLNNLFVVYFEILVRPGSKEEGFLTCTAVHHQGTIKTFWLLWFESSQRDVVVFL